MLNTFHVTVMVSADEISPHDKQNSGASLRATVLISCPWFL